MVAAGVAEYRTRMQQMAGMRNLDVWYAHIEVTKMFEQLSALATKKQRAKAEANVAKARTRDSLQAFSKLTHEVDGQRRIISDPPLIVPIEELIPADAERRDVDGELHALIRSYRRTLETDRRELLESFEYVHSARKVVGVGSVGTRAWILLLLGRDGQDPLFLQAKEAQESVLERFVGKSKYPNSGQRVVAGQRLMQATSDIFLGWQRVTGLDGVVRDFYLRQLRDWKGSADVDTMTSSVMTAYARICGCHPGPRPRPLRRPHRHRLLPGHQRRLRQRHRRLLGRLRRPERTRLRGHDGGCEVGTAGGTDRALSSHRPPRAADDPGHQQSGHHARARVVPSARCGGTDLSSRAEGRSPVRHVSGRRDSNPQPLFQGLTSTRTIAS